MPTAEQVEPVEVACNPWGIILHHEDWQTLELRWLPVELSDADFKETLTLLADLGERYKPRFMIIDATEFHHQFGPGVMEWRDENIIPRYGAAGVTKFAFLVSPGFPEPLSPVDTRTRRGARPSRPAGFPPASGPTGGSPRPRHQSEWALRQ